MIELDKHIEILLLNNDCVIIPNFGGFMAHYVEARKDDGDNAFLPPMRTVGFNPKLTINDSLLAQSYVEVYDISYPEAIERIEDEVRELKQHIINEGEYELNHIGLLYLNDFGAYEFEPSSAGILTPSLYGLGYFEMPTLDELEEEINLQAETIISKEISDIKDSLQKIGISTIDEEVNQEKRKHTRIITMWQTIAAACIALIIFILVPTPLSNNNEHLLEGKINTKLLDYIMPKELVTGKQNTEKLLTQESQRLSRHVETKKQEVTEEPTVNQDFYTIVLASRVTRSNAQAYVELLKKRGYEAEVWSKNKSTKVVYGKYPSQTEAATALKKLNNTKEFSQAWLMKY